MRTSNLTDGGGGQTLGSTPNTSLNNNQFGKTVAAGALGAAVPVAAAAPKVAKAAAGVAGKAVGAQVNAAKAVGGAAAKALPTVAKAAGGAALALNPAARAAAGAGAVAYGASQTPGGKSIIKGAVQGAKGPNMGLGVAGAPLGAIKGAMNSKGFGNVVSGAAKGGALGMLAGPAGGVIGAGIGAIGGLFSNRGMGGKPKAPTAPGKAVPNRATPYTVQKGDTLTSIAKAKGTTVDALRQANPKMTAPGSKYNNGNMIWSGTKVNMPGSNNQKMKDAGKGLKVNKNMAGK